MTLNQINIYRQIRLGWKCTGGVADPRTLPWALRNGTGSTRDFIPQNTQDINNSHDVSQNNTCRTNSNSGAGKHAF